MITDSLLAFVPIGGNQSLVGGAGVSFPSVNVIDVTGAGVGQPPPNIIGNATLAGWDPGVGGRKIEIEVLIGTAFTTGNAATLNVQFQGSIDTAVTYQPASWVTFVESGAIAAANLTANQKIRLDWPVEFPDGVNPRYFRLNFSIPSGTNFTAGVISAAIVTMVRDDQANKFASANYKVA